MKKLILHVGMHKTASSSIQSTLANNIELLSEQNICFPIFNLQNRNIDNHSIPIYSLFCENPEKYHINIRFGVDIESQHLLYRNQLDSILQNNDFIIISGEDISILSENSLKKMKEYLTSYGHELEVHCILRQPYSLLCSMIQQNIKGGLESLENISIIKISSMVKKLLDTFDNLKFHSFSKLKNVEQGFVPYFLSILGVNSNGFKMVNTNEGLGGQTTRLLNYVNKRVPSFIEGAVNPLRQGFHQIENNFNCDHTRFLLNSAEFSLVRHDLEVENETLFRLLGNRDFLDSSYPIYEDKKPEPEFIKAVISKSKRLPKSMKRACYDYLQDLITDSSISSLLDDFFENKFDFLNADLARNTAMLWEDKNLNNALLFMSLAKERRPSGELINRKLEEYKTRLYQLDQDEK